jgi:hypothetical protein
MNFGVNLHQNTKCPETQIFMRYTLRKRVRSHTNEFWWKSSPDHKLPRNTKFHGLYHLKTFEKSEKLNVVRSIAGPQNAPNHKISWATTFENVWEVTKMKYHKNYRLTRKCPETPILMGYILWKRVKIHKKKFGANLHRTTKCLEKNMSYTLRKRVEKTENEMSRKLSPYHKIRRNTKFYGLYQLKRVKSHKNEFWWASSPDHNMPRITKIRGLYPLKRLKNQ